MNLHQKPRLKLLLPGVILALSLATLRSQANVYATNIRVNGDITNVVASGGDTITITYLLNEPASLGTTIEFLSGNTIVRSNSLPAGGSGTVRGFNIVSWDTGAMPIPNGTYSIAVIPRSAGYTNWTQITSDTADPNTYVNDGRGIAIDRNPSSPYYGRVFVSNATAGPNPNLPNDIVGILKFNADTSGADEGISSAGIDGYNWLDGGVSPWKLQVSADDHVYVDDLATNGQVFSWDPTISSNSMVAVLRQDNQSAGQALSGPALVGTGINTQLWMANTNQPQILKWQLNANGSCVANDPGVIVASSSMVTNFYDVALDPAGNVYTCSYVLGGGDPSPRVFRYHAPTAGAPVTNADWAVGAGNDTYAGASGIAVDPTGTYIAVSFEGTIDLGFGTNGNTKILWATNGALVTNLDLGVLMQNDPNHDDTDCAWDAAGNVYYIDNYFSAWRAVSPPGTNQATTIAVSSVQVVNSQTSTPIQITLRSVSNGTVTMDFSAGPTDSIASFTIQSAATVNGTYALVSAANIVQLSPGLFRATCPTSGTVQFYRVRR
jgi:hypothetical protein